MPECVLPNIETCHDDMGAGQTEDLKLSAAASTFMWFDTIVSHCPLDTKGSLNGQILCPNMC